MNKFTLLDLPNKPNKSVTVSDSKFVSPNDVDVLPAQNESIIGIPTAIVSRKPIETPTLDVIPTLKKTITDNIGVRPIIDKFGQPSFEKVGEFPEVGKIRLSGDYTQNFVDFPKFGLNITPLTDVTFRFILSIKKTIDDINPSLYTSKIFYDELIDAYAENNPYFVSNVIKQQAIVTILYDDLLKKIEQYRVSELNVAKVGVVVNKNLFVKSNYTRVDGALPPSLKANPTINLEDLVKYVDWVVSKPSVNYDDRLLSEKEIGEWTLTNPKGVDTAEPVVSSTPSVDEPPRTPTQRIYPPVGRAGFYQGEEISASDGNLYAWTIRDGGKWELQGPSTPAPSNNNNSGNPGGNRRGTL